MQIASSAMRTCIASLSAVECTATVAMPISRAARTTRSAISPRLAIRILSNIAPASLDDHQRAPYSTGAVLDEDALDRACLGAGDLVHGLHRLDDQKGLALDTLSPTDTNEGEPGSGCM
jgi:hypothetical protein